MENNLEPRTTAPSTYLAQKIQPEGYATIPSQDANFRYYFNILIKRKWLVLAVFLCTLTVACLYAFLMTPIYRATSVLQITQDNSSVLLGERDPFAALYSAETQGRFYETQYMLLTSRPMAYRIIDSLGLYESQEFKSLQKDYPDKSLEEVQGKYADIILDSLDVKPLRKSYLVEVNFTSPDKVLAQKVVNLVSQEYMKLAMNTRRQSYELIRSWLEGELQTLANKVEESEKKVYEYGRNKDFLALEDKKENTVISKYVELNTLVTKAQAERVAKEAQYKQIQAKGLDAPLITNNPLIQKLREDTIAHEGKVASLNKIYDVNYPQLQAEKGKLLEMNARLNAEIKRIRTSIESDYEAAKRTEDMLQEALLAQKSQVGDLQENLVKHHILKRDMQANEQLYQGLLSRMKEASVASTMVSSNVAAVVPAELPSKPYKPRKLFDLALGTFLGLAGGIGLAFLVEFFDNSIQNSGEMEAYCYLPTLGVVPYMPKTNNGLGEVAFATYSRPKSRLTESIRHIRTALMLSSPEGAPATLMVTSPNPNEGKSTVAINLAISFTMNDQKVVVVDADLRKPFLHQAFGQPAQPGLSNYLTGTASMSEVVRSTEIPNLFFVPAGTVPPSPTELLITKEFENFLAELRSEFRYVLVDTPPIIEFADGRALSPLLDGVVILLKYGSTSREEGRLARELLQQVNARVVGGVLNMSQTNRLGYNYFKYYYYGKNYGKYYGEIEESPKRRRIES